MLDGCFLPSHNVGAPAPALLGGRLEKISPRVSSYDKQPAQIEACKQFDCQQPDGLTESPAGRDGSYFGSAPKRRKPALALRDAGWQGFHKRRKRPNPPLASLDYSHYGGAWLRRLSFQAPCKRERQKAQQFFNLSMV